LTFFALPSLVALLVQAIGALLIASLCLVLQQTVRRAPLVYWAIGWFSLFFALIGLFCAFTFSEFQHVGQFVFLMGEYIFGYLVMVGCRLYVRGQEPSLAEAWLLIPAAVIAILLPRLGDGNFDVFFTAHTLIYSYLFLAAFRVMWRVQPWHGSLTGVRVTKIALLLLTLDYAHYAPLFAASSMHFGPPTLPYLVYAPLYDLIFLMLLAFGMLMVMTGEVQHALETANADLAKTRDRLATMAQLDHLTSALNRHSFYSMIEGPRNSGRTALSGCAAFADIDNMKVINDAFGHVAGDGAIRAVAREIRACIRADDLLFRWGGDEFLVLLIGVSESEARARLDTLNHRLEGTAIPGVVEPFDVHVSVGYAAFDSAPSLDGVIALADSAMYGKKRTTSY
jgi:diguanylate cyclase (GGDEF)-like protein